MKSSFFIQQSRLMAGKLQMRLGDRPAVFCLVTGAPRSGTTAFCQWMKQQERVAGFNETRILIALHEFMNQVGRFQNLTQNASVLVSEARDMLYSYYASKKLVMGKKVWLEKEPLEPIAFPDKAYDLFLQNVRTLVPGARFVFMVRSPLSLSGL